MGEGRWQGGQNQRGGGGNCEGGIVVRRGSGGVGRQTLAGAAGKKFRPVGCDSQAASRERNHPGEHKRRRKVEAEVARPIGMILRSFDFGGQARAATLRMTRRMDSRLLPVRASGCLRSPVSRLNVLSLS